MLIIRKHMVSFSSVTATCIHGTTKTGRLIHTSRKTFVEAHSKQAICLPSASALVRTVYRFQEAFNASMCVHMHTQK